MDDITKILKERIKKLPHYYVEIGVFSGDEKREKIINVLGLDLSVKDTKGITNAELMFIHENGSPVRGLPARPVLALTIDYANKELMQKAMVKGFTKYVLSGDINDLEIELNRLCVRMESYARWVIRQSSLLHKLKDSTIKEKNKRHKGKGASQPLLDTGQLANSITCRLIKEKQGLFKGTEVVK